jgi:hypothetical protein
MIKKKVDDVNFEPRNEEDRKLMDAIWRVLEEKWKKQKNQNLR